MSCIDDRTCHDTLESLYEALKNRNDRNGYFKDPILTNIVEKIFTPDEWMIEDIPLLRSIKNGGPVIDQDFKTVRTPIAGYFRKIARKVNEGKLDVFKDKIAYLVTVYGGSKSRRFKKRQRKSKKRRKSRLL